MAPEELWRARESVPKAGSNSRPGVAVSRVVPIAAASGRNARGNSAAAEYPGQFRRAQRGQIGVQGRHRAFGSSGAYGGAAVRQGGVQAARRLVRDDAGAQRGQLPSGQGVVRDYRHITDRGAGQRGRHGVLREGEGEPRAQPVVGRVRQPALGARQRFERYHQGPSHERPVSPLSRPL